MERRDVVVDFAQMGLQKWGTINDGVMGGVSDSRLNTNEHGAAVFAGNVSLENNGGFASVRGRLGHCDLSGFDGLVVRVRGDGKRYRLRLRHDDDLDGVTYQARFETREGVWDEVRLPLSSFEPTYRGRRLRDAEPLNAGAIHQIGFMIADGQAGPFRLEIARVEAYRTR